MKMKGLAATLDMTVALVMIGLLLAGGAFWVGNNWMRDIQSDLLRDECHQLEYALVRYGQNHVIVDTFSQYTDSNGALCYSMLKTYPASQAKLSELYDLGYLGPSIKMTDFQIKSASKGVVRDSSVTFYTVNSTKTKYRIEVMLPNGKKYVTPGSSSF